MNKGLKRRDTPVNNTNNQVDRHICSSKKPPLPHCSIILYIIDVSQKPTEYNRNLYIYKYI